MFERGGLLQAALAAQFPLHRDGLTGESLRFVHVASKKQRTTEQVKRVGDCQVLFTEVRASQPQCLARGLFHLPVILEIEIHLRQGEP